MANALSEKIEIPFGQGDEVLELEVANLPEPDVTKDILRDQNCRINLWIQIALEYYRQGKGAAFEELLKECLENWHQDRVRSVASVYPEGDKDRIKALDLLAIYNVRKGYRERKRDFFTEAAQKFTEVDKSEFFNARKHGSEYQFHLVGRAYMCLLEGRTDQADAQFSFVLQQQQQTGDPENVPSLLGRACIEFNKKEANGKRNALSLYKKALQVCPNCPADVRLGMGICFYKLNMLDKAEEAFQKALSLDPRCVGALTGLAVIELNRKTNFSIKRGMECLSKAFKIESTNPMVLTLLADHFFYANEHEKVIKLATRALEHTVNEAMQAQACYQLARAYHKRREYDKAFDNYYKATQFGGSQFFLAFYGLGQMNIHRMEYDQAISAFETVLKSNPDNTETLKILASLYARIPSSSTKKEQARDYLKKVTEQKPDDVEAWVELASLTEQHDTQTALAAYRTSIKLYDAKSIPVPPEIYNNIAALLFSIDALQESENYYNLAKQRCEEERLNNEQHYGSIIYTINYNLGRLYEAQHKQEEAEKTYKNILIQHPMYLDCYLRLGIMEREKGVFYNASDKFKEIFRIEPENADAWTLIANLHLSKLELTPCQKKFERILERTKTNPDLYSLISVGNVWLQSQYQNIKDKEKHNLQRHRALTFFSYALKKDPKNIYAANGIGCIFAVKGMFPEAREIFSQVREATADFPDVWINIAHIYVEQKQYVAAVQMYENCLKKFYNNSNVEILSYIARALFKANKLTECKKILLRARHICPYDLNVLFNLAKVLKTLARQIFEDCKSTYHSVVTAEYELKLARTYFRYYIENKENRSDRGGVDLDIVKMEERDCGDLLIQVDKSIKNEAEKRDKLESLRRLEHEEQMAKEMARKAEEEERRIREEQQKKEELENKRKELLKKQEEAKQKMLQEDSGGLIRDDESDEGEGRPRKKKKTGKEGKKKDKNSDRDKDRERGRSAEKEKHDNKKYKSKAILSSDSSSSEDDE